MVKTDKSLEEVWSWKEEIYQETKNMSMEERVKMIKENALRISQRYGLNLKIVDRRNRTRDFHPIYTLKGHK